MSDEDKVLGIIRPWIVPLGLDDVQIALLFAEITAYGDQRAREARAAAIAAIQQIVANYEENGDLGCPEMMAEIQALADTLPYGWRDIASAPRDGNGFIVYGRHAKDCPIQDGRDRYKKGDHWWAIGCWDIWRSALIGGERFVFCKDGMALDVWGEPTHWMPLPPAPGEG